MDRQCNLKTPNTVIQCIKILERKKHIIVSADTENHLTKLTTYSCINF